jgi:uncharacterized protein YbjT (DUF2867 family)
MAMSAVAVVGGTGTVGRHIVNCLRSRGEDPRVLSRRSAEHPVDLATGAGLAGALEGCDVVIDASNGPPRHPEAVLADGCRRLVEAASGAGVSHLVCISIVGIDAVPMGYYRTKLAQEAIVTGGSVPWSIVRCTQFCELVDSMLSGLARWRISPRSSARLQPLAAREAADAVADVAGRPPAAKRLYVAGPQLDDLSTLARVWAERRQRRGLPLPLPLPPKLGGPLRSGALTCASPDVRGSMTFAAFLDGQAAGAGW